MPAWFSKLMEYWKPEQPPPTTPMRRPAGIGSWVAIISLTLEMADSVSSTAFLRGASGPVTTSATGTAVVDMETSLFRKVDGTHFGSTTLSLAARSQRGKPL